MKSDELGDKVKTFENIYRYILPSNVPLIMRLDGKSFHQYTRNCKKPIDDSLIECMNLTAITLCEHIQGAQLGFVQSDEISILINNYKNDNTQPWFANNLQKIVSTTAALASVTFTLNSDKIFGKITPAYFDSRAFVTSKEEVNNAFIFRQNDCMINFIQMAARAAFSHKECEFKNTKELIEMLKTKDINVNDYPSFYRNGRCIIKTKVLKEGFNKKTNEKVMAERTEWVIDNNIPIFSENPNYIEQYV